MGFARSLRTKDYASRTILNHLMTAVHVGIWTQAKSISIADLDDAAIERYRRHLSSCRCPLPPARWSRDRVAKFRALLFLAHLREVGAVRSVEPATSSPTIEPALLAGFCTWMEQHRGARPATLLAYGRIVRDAINVLGDDPRQYDVAVLRAFVLDRSRRHGRSKAKLVMTAMRMFLRYLIAAEMCPAGLDAAIPTLPRWRLAALPRYLAPTDVERVIATCNTAHPSGLRDRAILLLLSRLGLRAGDVAGLRFSDIDWKGAKIRVAGKSRRTTWLPLPQDIGDAILTYLRQGRPRFAAQQIFLSSSPPRRPITAATVSCLVSKAVRLSGVVAPMHGAHVLRHSAAFAMLQDGASLEQIRTILRHQDAETTSQYAKVDVASLHEVAQPWPEVTP